MTTLRERLMAAMNPQHSAHATAWGNPRAMSESLREIRKAMGEGTEEVLHTDRLQQSLQCFASTQRVANFTELKYVCYGVTVPVGQTRWRLIDQTSLFDRLLGLVDACSSQPRQFRRCYQGLLNGYFGLDRQAPTSPIAGSNWDRLRGYLGQNLSPVLRSTSRRGIVPDWLQALSAHKNLLSEDPCSRYTRALKSGSSEELKVLCAALGISSTSWVWEEALMAYVNSVCDLMDAAFLRNMPGVIQIVNGGGDLKVADLLATRATGMTAARYARSADHPEHTDLRDACLRWIGNPWVNRTAWDAHAKSESARQMVEGWLKRHLIKNFFQLLAHDGAADLRRLNYWLKWEAQIADMWFVLGSDAVRNKSDSFMRLRTLMQGRERFLVDSTDENNAFVMRIGHLLIIEFGVTNNACFVYAASDFVTSLDQKRMSVAVLKQRAGAIKLSHNFGWERRFDETLRELLGSVPQSRGVLTGRATATLPAPAPSATRARPASGPTPAVLPPWPRAASIAQSGAKSPPSPSSGLEETVVPTGVSNVDGIRSMCEQHGLEWDDNRSKKGAFWVLMRDRSKHVEFARLLERLGFRYTPGQGYWTK